MGFVRDDRGVSTLIGAILLFGFAVILFSLYGAYVVPSENAEVEFNHFQKVENEFTALRADVLEAKRTNEDRIAVVTLGTRYPTRVLGLNPPAPSGSLRTANAGAVELTNTGAVTTPWLCNGSSSGTIETRSLVYQPRYNQFKSPEAITYEHTFVGRSYQGQALFGPQDMVTLNETGSVTQLDLVVLTGSYAKDGVSAASVDISASQTNTTTVTTSEFTLTLPSRFSAEQWTDEILPDADLTAADVGDDRVALTFQNTNEVTLRCGAVAIADENPTAVYDPVPGTDDANDDDEDDAGDPLPANAVAFHDADGNDVYSASETAYSIADLEDLTLNGDLVIEKNAVLTDGSQSGYDLDVEELLVKSGVTVNTTEGGQPISVTASSNIIVDGATLHTNDGAVTLESDGMLSGTGAELSSNGGGSAISLLSGDDMTLDDSTIDARDRITIDTGGELQAERVSLDTLPNGGAPISITSGSSMTINQLASTSISGLTVEAGGFLEANKVTLAVTGGGSSITIDSTSDISFQDADASGVDVEFDSRGYLNLNGTALDSASWGSLSGDLTGNADLFVEDASFTANGSPTNFEYSPPSVDVIGNPDDGSTTT